MSSTPRKNDKPESSKRPVRKEANTHSLRRTDLAYVELASSELARDINRDVVLELLRASQPMSRADLARASGLNSSTVTSIIKQLLDEGWIVEGSTLRRPRGRHPILLSLNDEFVMLAVDVRPEHAMVAVVDLNGRLLSQQSILLSSDVEKATQALIGCLTSMRDQHPDKTFEGVGLAMPGRVDPDTNKLVLAPNLRWRSYDIAAEIERALGIKVEMENEANACLIAEVWSGRLDGVRNAVLVAISEGIGTAILTNGQMVTGKGGLAGEFGHVTLDPAGPLCGCGRTGCWEMYASTRASLHYYAELSGGNEPAISARRLLNLAAEGDVSAVAALTRQAEYLARGLHVITSALSPEVILFTGEITSAWDQFCPVIEKQLRKELLAGAPPRLMTTMNSQFARLRGAAALVLQRHSGYHRTHQAGNGKSKILAYA